jgi:hypothetical protein
MDPHVIDQLRQYLSQGTTPAESDLEARQQLMRLASKYKVLNRVLYYQQSPSIPPKYVVSRHEVLPILRLQHDEAGHRGADSTIERIRRDFYWPNMETDIRAFVRGCPACQRFLPARRVEPLHPIPVHSPFHTISIDTIGPLPDSHGARHVIIAVDHFTKWCEARSLFNHTANTAATFVYEDIICRHGCPNLE